MGTLHHEKTTIRKTLLFAMSKYIDLTGKKFGTLTVISRAEDKIYVYHGKPSIHVSFNCICDCGKSKDYLRTHLNQKKIPSCSNDCRNKFITNGMIGKKVNKITILNGPISVKKHGLYWDCSCDCGNLFRTSHQRLYKNKIKSCSKCASLKAITDFNKLKKPAHNRLNHGEASFNGLYSSYKMAAMQRGYEFSLSKVFFRSITSSDCFYCKISGSKEYPSKNSVIKNIELGKHSGGSYFYNGIDRKDNKIGYVEENCLPCCFDCNRIKNTMPYADFIEKIKKIYFNIIGVKP